MSKVNKWRLGAAFFGIALATAIAISVHIALTDRQTADDIHRQELSLLKLGIDVRRPMGQEDAAEDYADIIADNPVNGQGQSSKVILYRFEQAVKKPYLNPSFWQTNMYRVMDVIGHLKIIAPDDYANRVFRTRARFAGQLLSMNDISNAHAYQTSIPLPVDWKAEDSKTRKWYRGRLESNDMAFLVRGAICGVFRRARLIVLQDETLGVADRHRLDSNLLRHMNLVSRRVMTLAPLDALGLDIDNLLLNSLKQDSSPYSKWLVSHLLDRRWGLHYAGFTKYRVALIQIDLTNSIEEGKFPRPSWSERYCFDPEIDAPIKIQVDAKRIVISARSTTGSWSEEIAR